MRIINFIILFAITFWFRGNTLYWADTETHKPEYYLKFQLNHEDHPTINKDDIVRISDDEKGCLEVFTKDKVWTVHYSQNADAFDWYVSDWGSI